MNDPLEAHADAAAVHFGFTPGERDEYLRTQRAISQDPRLAKRLVKHQRRVEKALRMSPTIKTRSR